MATKDQKDATKRTVSVMVKQVALSLGVIAGFTLVGLLLLTLSMPHLSIDELSLLNGSYGKALTIFAVWMFVDLFRGRRRRVADCFSVFSITFLIGTVLEVVQIILAQQSF